MKKIKQIIITLALMIGVGSLAVPATAGAVNVYKSCNGVAVSDSAVCAGTKDTIKPIIKAVVNTLLFVVGIISIIMIIVGGLQYTTSAGDSSAVSKAKNTVLYSIIGLVIAFSTFAIVNWVLRIFG